MSYASGGLIQATDYNILAWGGTQNTYVATPNNVAYVMGTGSGAFGYGQDVSLINTVSASGIVTAAQWAGLFYLMNRALGHQGSTQLGGGGNVNAVAGATITYFANVFTAANTINTGAASYFAQGTTSTGTTFWSNISNDTDGLAAHTITRTITWASQDSARYFFNAGGALSLVLNFTGGNGTGSTLSTQRLITGIGGIAQYRNDDNTGRSGTGITLDTNATTLGYRDNTTVNQTIVAVTDTTSSYTGSTGTLAVRTTATGGGNGANGNDVIFTVTLNVADKTWDDTITLNISSRIDIIPPETTYLTNSWGTPTVT